MRRLTVTVQADICVENKYCSRSCQYYNDVDYSHRCELFQRNLPDSKQNLELIRCPECIKAERERQ